MPSKPLPLDLPFLDKISDDSSAALKSTYAIASVGIATLKMLETLLPAAAKEVEHESKNLAENFTTLIEHVNSKCNPPEPIADAIAGIVMGMQFQDRNTQIMENVATMLERYRSMLEEVCRNIEISRDGHIAAGQNIAEAVEGILSSIRLSDIRTRYLDALAKAKVHSHPEQGKVEAPVKEPDSIELF